MNIKPIKQVLFSQHMVGLLSGQEIAEPLAEVSVTDAGRIPVSGDTLKLEGKVYGVA